MKMYAQIKLRDDFTVEEGPLCSVSIGGRHRGAFADRFRTMPESGTVAISTESRGWPVDNMQPH
ncbi:hypothetical protein EYF80_063044 [Liparis tanakae]|uniref:Uncharacterized protein n=1 Tax=Liparis tanakae TaxID=230148 RepID=A0A4Z2ED31_9TELE|nr:hypothetical protein EYF80_063044 [Liparis tanakae]